MKNWKNIKIDDESMWPKEGLVKLDSPHADNRGRDIYGNTEPNVGDHGRGYLKLWGGIIQKHRGYMMRNNPGPYITANIGMDKQYMFDNNLYFPPPGAITISECESNTVRMGMIGYGRPE